MINLLLDTNILIYILRKDNYESTIQYLNPDNSPIYLSIVSEAEVKSIAIKNNWGQKRLEFLDYFLDQVNIIEVNQFLVNIYVEIDSYSQRLNSNFEYYSFSTPRNMGKNDLWIASLAALLGLKLITTDSDFDHLDKVFFEVQKIPAAAFTKFRN